MTRSEQIQKQIDKIKATCEKCKIKDIPGIECCALKLALELFLAEQKRSEGCAFCRNKENEHGFFIDGNVLFYEDGKLGTEGIIITTCPHCGRDLTEGESV